MFNAGAIMGTLGLDASGFTRGMLQAQGLMQVFPSFVTNFMANPLLGLIDVFKRAGAALVGMVTGFADEADKIGDIATNIGTSVEFLSGLSLVAEQAGSGLDDVADGLKMLGRNAAEAARGGGSAHEAFSRMGISVVNANGQLRPLSELMMEVADGLAQLPEGGVRTAAAMDIFGRSGTNLVGTLSQGSKAIVEQMHQFDAYGRTITSQGAKVGGAWNDLMNELSKAWEGFKHMIAQPILEALMPQLQKLMDWVKTHPAEIRAAAESIGQTLASVVSNIQASIDSLLSSLAKAFVMLSTIKGAVEGMKIGSAFGPKGAIIGGIGGGIVGFAGSTYALGKMNDAAASFTNNNNSTTYNAQINVTSDGVTPAMRQAAEELGRQWKAQQAMEATRRVNLGM